MMFSIIIPVYNVAPYLRECLDSVLAQTFTDWEAICVDDGSTDGSGAILDEYAARDSRFRVIHQENSGTHLARLLGIAKSRGEWIGFHDADDAISVQRFELFAKKINNSKCDIVMGDIVERHEDGRYWFHPYSIALKRTRPLVGRRILEVMLASNGAEYQWHVLYGRVYRRDVVTRTFEFLKSMHGKFVMCEDVGWSIALALSGKQMDFVHGAPYIYFRNSRSSTHSGDVTLDKLSITADHFAKSIKLAHAALKWGNCSELDHALVNTWFLRYLKGWEASRRRTFPELPNMFEPLVKKPFSKMTDGFYGKQEPIAIADLQNMRQLSRSAILLVLGMWIRRVTRMVFYPIVVLTRPIRYGKVKHTEKRRAGN